MKKDSKKFLITIGTLAIVMTVVFLASFQQVQAPANGLDLAALRNLSSSSGHPTGQQIAVSGNNVYVVWYEETQGSFDVFLSRSIDAGVSFPLTGASNLSNTPGYSINPEIAVSGSNLYVVWEDDSLGNFDIFFTRSADTGISFDSTINLSNTLGISAAPQIAVSGNNVYVVWSDDTPENSGIFFTKSNNGGASFDKPVNLSASLGVSGNFGLTRIIASGDNVYLSWSEEIEGKKVATLPGSIEGDGGTILGNEEIFLTTSNDNGATFGPVINLSNTEGRSTGQQIAVSGNNVYVVWYEEDQLARIGIILRTSNDNGATFGSPVVLTNNAGTSFDPLVTASANNVYVIWFDSSLGNFALALRVSNDNGASFARAVVLTGNAGSSFDKQIMAVSGFNVFVAWDGADLSGIYLRKSNDNGASFSPAVKISEPSSITAAGSPRLAVAGNNVHAVWNEGLLVDSEIIQNRELIYKKIE
ncbi:MAG: sialidase family protein [Nitrososphaerales archaeon]